MQKKFSYDDGNSTNIGDGYATSHGSNVFVMESVALLRVVRLKNDVKTRSRGAKMLFADPCAYMVLNADIGTEREAYRELLLASWLFGVCYARREERRYNSRSTLKLIKIMIEPKQRAARNKTLTVNREEVAILEASISNIDHLKNRIEDDSIINADLLECLDFIPDNYFDLIIIDPPYNLDKNFHGTKFTAMKADDYEGYLRSWFYKVCDKLKDNGSLYMCGDWKCSSSMQRVIEEKLTIINRITWQREKGRGAQSNWKNGMEDIWFAVKNPQDYYFDVKSVMVKRKVMAPYRVDGKPKDWEETDSGRFRVTYPSNFWDDISIPFWSMSENTDHPTQKPEKLYAKLVLASSKEGDRIFDPFLGSGTTAVVAKKFNRRYFGVELNREYCLWAAKRLINAADDKSIQGYADGVFWERHSFNEQTKCSDCE